jgi:hypothetical protein
MLIMVYVSIVDVILNGNLWNRLYALVRIENIGYIPSGHRECMNFITKLFRELYYELGWIPSDIVKDDELLSDLILFEYVVHELIKDKIYLTSFPYNTYNYKKCKSGSGDGFDCYMIYLYVDADYSYKYIYHVEQPYLDFTTYKIRGYHIGDNRIDIDVEFYDKIPTHYKVFPNEFIEKVERLAKDKETHIDYYVASKKTKKLINTVLTLVKKH